MKFIAIFLSLYIFLKSWYYGLFEFKEMKNKPAGISIFIMSACGLIIFLYSIILEF